MSNQRYYRLRIRNGDDTANALVITSVPTSAFMLDVPNGDGLSFDPLKGSITTGTYSVRVIDAETGVDTRVVTEQLADANARQQLLSRRAIVEVGDDGVTWPLELQNGYVNAVRLTGGLVYEFAIGDTQRKEVSTDIFTAATVNFDKTTSIIGGPIRGGFGPIKDYGGWGYTVTQVASSPDYVQMKVVPGKIFDPRKANVGPQFRNLTSVSSALANYTNSVAKPYFQSSPTWASVSIPGSYPGLRVRVQETDGTLVGFFTPLSYPVGLFLLNTGENALIGDVGQSSLYVDWVGGVGPDGETPIVGTPTVGHEYSVYVYVVAINADNPLHYEGHPVDMWELIRIEAGIPYDATVLPAVKAEVGDDLLVSYRIDKSYKVGTFDEQCIYGPFGLCTRMVNGERQLFSSRAKGLTVPTATLTIDDLREPGKPFDLDEATAIKRVELKRKVIVPWTTIETSQPAPDALIATDVTISIDNSDDDQTVTNAGTVTYDIPGDIKNAAGNLDIVKWLAGSADEIFDRWGRGIHSAEHAFLPSATQLIGEEVVVDFVHMPVAVVGNSPVTQRGGQRVFQVVARTETPTGPNLKLLDAGSADTPTGVVPTFTVAANTDDTRKLVDLSITNGPAIVAVGGKVRVWVATGTSPASGSGYLLTTIDPAVTTALTLPAFNAGAHVWVQLQTVITDQRPSALSAFDDVDLDDLDPVTSLAVSTQDAGDPSRRMLTWVVGTNAADIPVEVSLRLTADPSSANRVVAVLPAGSTQYELTGLDTANRTASVRHIEAAPFSGASSYATIAVNTTGAFRTLDPPINPVGFSMADGTYGMYVTATEFPSEVEFQVKIGIGGTFETVDVVTSNETGTTGFTDIAPNDGETRYMRARHIADGLTESSWTATVTADPWITSGPPPPATSGGCTRAFAFLVGG